MNCRRFLFSLAMLPACESAVSTDDGDPRVPDGGDPARLQGSCRAAYSQIYACYEEYDTGGYETGGYDTESYEPEDYSRMFCDAVESYAEEYGAGCPGALEEVYACIASLDCDEIFADDVFVAEPCADVVLDASRRCPELISQCASTLSSGSSCDVTASECIDGNTYHVACDPTAATGSCTCTLNGDVTATVTIDGGLECGSAGWADEVAAACNFPRGAF